MIPTLYQILRWIHILAMVGLFGGLLLYQLALSQSARREDSTARAAVRLWNLLLAIGLAAGLWMYLHVGGFKMGGHYNGVVGLKFMVLLAVGALLPISRRRANGDTLRWICIGLLFLASFMAFTI